MSKKKCDFHIHSCLSPCGDDDMSPVNIAGISHLCGLEYIAVTDHNCAENLPAVIKACEQYNITVLCGIEVCTSEEIHVLCYFKTLKEALEFSNLIAENSFKISNNKEIYGNQFVMDDGDSITEEIDRLLIIGCNFSVYELVDICHTKNGICIYAHIDKQSFSVISVLGAIPIDIAIDGVEIYDLSKRDMLIEKGYITKDTRFMSNSDAHNLWTVGEKEQFLCKTHPLYNFILP